MASVHCGQGALLALPSAAQLKANMMFGHDSTLAHYTLPPSLQVERKSLRSGAEVGIEVWKVAKNGRLQSRRLAFSPHHRSLYVTTQRVNSVRSLWNKVQQGTSGPSGAKMIDISRIDHILKGQMTRRFHQAKSVQLQRKDDNYNTSDVDDNDTFATGSTSKKPNIFAEEATSLSIVYRDDTATASSTSSAASALRANIRGEKQTLPPSPFESLDLIVADPRDYGNLLTALEDLLQVYKKERKLYDRDVLLLHYYWIDFGKDPLKDGISAYEFADLCERLQVPLKKSYTSSVFKDRLKELRKQLHEEQRRSRKGFTRRKRQQENNNPNDPNMSTSSETASISSTTQSGHMLDRNDLPLWAVLELLQDIRYQTLTHCGIKYVHQDPLLHLWQGMLGTDPVPGANAIEPKDSNEHVEITARDAGPDRSISSVAFLSFLRSEQKEFKRTLEEALDLMKALNGQVSAKELAGGVFGDSMYDITEGDGVNDMQANDRLTKGRFFQYLLSDANDLMDPALGKVGADDMTSPLSHYWINTSHDTYLNCWGGYPGNAVLDEEMYLAALYRGVRCLELDVWDGIPDPESGESASPVIAREKPKTHEDTALPLSLVLKSVRLFLLSNPKSYPVILNVENHCSYAVQERMAEQLFQILGSIGLIVVPDDSDSVDEADLLPSPSSMRGKVLVMGKRPRVIRDGAKVINDDYDAENDILDEEDEMLQISKSREEEEETRFDKGVVIGFDSQGPIRSIDPKVSRNMVKHTPGELLFMAKQELEQAKIDAAQAEIHALNESEEADKMEKHSDSLIRDAGLTKEAVLELASEVRGAEIDPVEHSALLARAEGEGVEIQEFFADAVEHSRTNFTECDQRAIIAAEDATTSLQKLNSATVRLREAESLLEESYVKERENTQNGQRAASDARNKREHADEARRRVDKVKQLLKECETSASSAETVVVTAMTEAKISEKRATETEARATRAAATAKKDRARADDETRKEEELERQASVLHKLMAEAATRARENRERIDKASSMLDRTNEQIKLIEKSSQYVRERQEQADGTYRGEEKKESGKGTPAKTGKLIAKHASKVEERRVYSNIIAKAKQELAQAERRRLEAKDTFEKKAHIWKTQADIASKARRISDKSSQTAEDLAEHAEEEREAANLRRAAREKAKSHVAQKDSYRSSLKAQLREAEKQAREAEQIATKAREDAERISSVKEEATNHDDLVIALERQRAVRDAALEEYEVKKKAKEEADAKAADAKRVFDTSETIYSEAMRNAAEQMREVDVQRLADRTAIVAFNRARLQRKQADHSLERARYAQSVVTEKQVIIKRAEEYKEKTDRISEIPTSLAKMTFMHTTRYKYWSKSLKMPNTHVHSFAQSVLTQMVAKDTENSENIKDFTSEHICRTFPSWKDISSTLPEKMVINEDPLSQWALGCQLVSVNYSTFDRHVLKADGRFRRNGSCGYVLKPEFMTNRDVLPERPDGWTISVLCGNCLPSPSTSSSAKKGACINPYVKITVYGGSVESTKAEFCTHTVEKNGINPVWDDKAGFTFKSLSPSTSIIVFTVWDKPADGMQPDRFVAASAMPVSCMREGYRSVALFDMYHTRSGPHAYASLLVRAQKITA